MSTLIRRGVLGLTAALAAGVLLLALAPGATSAQATNYPIPSVPACTGGDDDPCTHPRPRVTLTARPLPTRPVPTAHPLPSKRPTTIPIPTVKPKPYCTPTPSKTPTPTETPTPTPTPTDTETPTPTPTPSDTETPTPTPTPSDTETPTPTVTPSDTPSSTPETLAYTGPTGDPLAALKTAVATILIGCALLVLVKFRRRHNH